MLKEVIGMPKKEGAFVGCHHNARGEPLLVVMGDDGQLFEVGTVDGIERLIASYREHHRLHHAAA
ncbi:MAG: hypothetical protein ACOH2N_04735 [Devosia sp.]